MVALWAAQEMGRVPPMAVKAGATLVAAQKEAAVTLTVAEAGASPRDDDKEVAICGRPGDKQGTPNSSGSWGAPWMR
jgi:hypothetical protein